MSESESRILPWPGPGRPPGPPGGVWGRPPTGAWPPGPLPPGPGPFPQPPDVFSAFAWLAKNYQESQAAKAFLKLLIQDLIAEDPTFLANAQATVGVTDGSLAQPGMVGEVVQFGQTITGMLATNQQSRPVVMGVLPPGDWDVWAWMNSASQVTEVVFNLQPVPDGFREALMGVYETSGLTVATVVSAAVVATPVQPTVLIFQVMTNVPADNTELNFVVTARRRR